MFIFICFLFVQPKSSKIPLDTICDTSSSTNYKCLPYTEATGNLANESYVNLHKLDMSFFTYNISGSKIGYPATNLFDKGIYTFWVSDKPNSDEFHNFLEISFQKNISLEAFLYDVYFMPHVQFCGTPTILKVFTSIGSNQLVLHTVFQGTPIFPWERFQFVFETPVFCDKIKIEFVEVTPDKFSSRGALHPVSGGIIFIRHYDSDVTNFGQVEGNYSNNEYIKNHKIDQSMFTYDVSGSRIDHPKEFIFDGDYRTCWVSEEPNSNIFNNWIMVNFTESVLLEGFLYYILYTSNGTINNRIFHGAPKELHIYSSIYQEPFKLKMVFKATPVYPWSEFQFIFPTPLLCDKIKIVFDDITPDFFYTKSLSPVTSGITLLRKNDILIEKATGKYTDSSYITSNVIPNNRLTYDATGSNVDFPLSNAFDGNDATYWISNTANNDIIHNTITVNFPYKVNLEAILYDLVYTDNDGIRTFNGIPIRLHIFTALGKGSYQIQAIFVLSPENSWSKVQIVLPVPAECDKLKIEFGKVNGNKIPQSSGLMFFQSFNIDPIPFVAEGSHDSNLGIYAEKMSTIEFSYMSTSEKSNQPISFAFDDNFQTYWASEINSEFYHNAITVTFHQTSILYGFLYDLAYSYGDMQVHGGPIRLNVYSSKGNEVKELRLIYKKTPIYSDKRLKFDFPKPIECDIIELEFVEVTPDHLLYSDGLAHCATGGITLIRYTGPDTVNYTNTTGIFDDYNYVKSHTINTSYIAKYETSSSRSDYPIENAFDKEKK